MKQNTHPFDNLNVNQLQQELQSRRIDISHLKKTKKDLYPTLKKSLKGIKRVPIMMIQDPLKELGKLGLDKYEISMLEGIHDISSHIENVLEELPHHMKDPHKTLFTDILTILNLEKDRK